ncbi:MAG: HAD family hydrolase [Dehalococcoidia bacterium]|nr:HAD family hydrolase [Dehalococcoidia bacterium]
MLKSVVMRKKDNGIAVVSFDVEGTLVTTDFSSAIWFELIPGRYSRRHGLNFEEATMKVRQAYDSIGDQRLEWYDVQYWFTRFDLGDADIAMEELQPKVQYYPDTKDVLKQLQNKYKLSVASGSPRPFLKHLLRDIEHNFSSIYSSTSDYQQVKTADFWSAMCRDLGVDPGQVIHVGDHMQFDFVEPASIGIKAFHLDRNRESGMAASLQSLNELVPLLADTKK